MIQKNTCKKRILLNLCVIAMMLFICCPLRAQAAKIGASDIYIGSVKTTAVSVGITENTGLMGFKITVLYPSNILSVDSVERGTVTKLGSFASNHEKDGQIVVVWNNTEEISSDGSLFNIILSVKDQSKSGTIRFSYSEEDTFDENYESVKLELNPISVKGKKVEVNTEQNNSSTSESSSVSSSPTDKGESSYDHLKIISDILKDYDLSALTESEKNNILDRINSDFRKFEFPENFSSYDQAMLFYDLLKQDANKNQIKDNYSYEEIHKVTQDVLTSVGAQTFSELDSSNKDVFAEKIKDSLPKADIDDLESDEIIEAIEEIITDTARSEEVIPKKEISPILWAVLSVVIIVVIAMLIYIIFILRRERNAKHKKSF